MCVSKVFGQTSRLITSFIVALILFTTSQTEAQILKFKHRNAAFQAGLEYVREMWFSPDNKFAYSASSGGLGVFDYDPITGSLTMKEVHNMEQYGFERQGMDNIVFNHDGEYAYTTTSATSNIYIFKRDAITGKITFLGQVPGVVDSYGTGSSLYISPDDKFLYIGNGSVLNIYKRNLSDGSVVLVKREVSQVSQGDIYISQDGKFMYLSGAYIRAFTRDTTTGLITFLEEYLGLQDLGYTYKIAAVRDENYMLFSSLYYGIGRFSRDASTGRLTFLDIFTYPRPESSAYPIGPASLTAFKVNAAGDKVYASSFRNLTSYFVDANGELTLLEKINVRGVVLNEPFYGVNTSHDEKFVYGFGTEYADTSIECFKENNNELDSMRIHFFGQSLNRGLYHVSAECISKDNQFIFTGSFIDKCFAAFRSGVNEGGEMTEINRVTFQQAGIPDNDNYLIKNLVATSDNKTVYASANSYFAPYSYQLHTLDVDANGAISHRTTLDLPAGIEDMQLTEDQQFLYISCSDDLLRIYRTATSGGLTLVHILSQVELGVEWSPGNIVIGDDDKLIYVLSAKPNSYLMLYVFNRDMQTGLLQLTSSTEVTYGLYKNTFKLLLSKVHQMAYVAGGSTLIFRYPWNSVTGELGPRAQMLGDYNGGQSLTLPSLNPEENMIISSSASETRFYGFRDDETVVKISTQKNIATAYWSSGGGESGYERFLFASDNKTVYGVRESGNGVYVYGYDQTAVPPLPPTNLLATSGDRKITISWDTNKESGITYWIYRHYNDAADVEGGNAEKIGETTALSFVDNTVASGTTVFYWVKAVLPNQSSLMSLPSNSAIAFDLIPTTPQNVLLTAGDKFLKLNWSANTEDDFLKYEVYKNLTSDSESASLFQTITVNSIQDDNVAYLQTYYYFVRTIDRAGNKSDFSDAVDGMPINNPPVTPQDVMLTMGDRFLMLTWSANTEGDFSKYEVYKNLTSDPESATLFQTLTTTTIQDNDVEYQQTYYYFIKSIDNTGNKSGFSTAVTGMPLDNPPAKPENLTVSLINDGGVVIHWSANTEQDLKGYRLYRSTVNHITESALIAEQNLPTNNQFVDNENLQDMIYYWVTAFDTQNNSSAFSDVASIVITASENQGVDPIVMYPNPVNDFLEVKTPYTQSVFVFFDMQGRQMKQGNVPENGIIDIHDLASGSYRCKITSKHQAFVFSIIKK